MSKKLRYQVQGKFDIHLYQIGLRIENQERIKGMEKASPIHTQFHR